MALLKHLWRNERTRHALIAAALAAVLGAIEFFAPLKPLMWTAQAQIAPRSASGDIVFVELRDDSNEPNRPQARLELAGLIDALTEAGDPFSSRLLPRNVLGEGGVPISLSRRCCLRCSSLLPTYASRPT